MTAAAVVDMADIAHACSEQEVANLQEAVTEGDLYAGPLEGVVEVKTIAYRPTILIRFPISIVVPTRYWGEPPRTTSSSLSGGEWLIQGPMWCGPPAQRLGVTTYNPRPIIGGSASFQRTDKWQVPTTSRPSTRHSGPP